MHAPVAFPLTVALLVSLAMPLAAQQGAGQRMPVDLELVLAVDVSGSIDAVEGRLQRQGYVDAIADAEVVRAIRSGIHGRIAVTYFEWAGNSWQTPVLDWTVIDGPDAARDFARRLSNAPIGSGPWTSISDAIRHAAPLFDANAYESARRIIDISGDGPNNTGGLVTQARDEALARRITINGLPIMNDRIDLSRPPMPNLDLYYENCVIGGPGAFIVVAESFSAFARAIRRKLILEIAGGEPPAAPRRTAVPGLAQATGAPPRARWVPPCDEGERRFRGIIEDN